MVLPLDAFAFAFNFRTRMWDLLLGGVDPVIELFIKSILPSLLLFTGVLLIVSVGIKVMTYFADINSKLDPFVLVRPIIVMGAMTLYTQLVPLLIFTPNEVLNDVVTVAKENVKEKLEINYTQENPAKHPCDGLAVNCWEPKDWFHQCCAGGKAVSFTVAATSLFYKAHVASVKARFLLFTNPGEFFDTIWTSVKDKIVGTVIDIFVRIFSWLVNKLVYIAPIFILAKQALVAGLFYMLGIFVLPLSLIPGNQKVLTGWFSGFFAVMLWLPLTNIMLTINLILLISFDNSSRADDGLLLLLMQIVNFIMIFQIPKYAKILVTGGGEISTGTTQVAAAAIASSASSRSKSLLKKSAPKTPAKK